MLAQFLGIGLDARLGHDDRDNRVAPLRIFDADDCDIVHVRVLNQHLLQLSGRDVFAAADDGVVTAPADEQ